MKAIIGDDFPFAFVSQKIDLPELQARLAAPHAIVMHRVQGDPIEISKQKCMIAAEKVGR